MEKIKSSGRKKGTPNKKTRMIGDILNELAHCPVNAIHNLLPQLSTSDQLKANLKLLDYIYPKRSTIDYYPLNKERPLCESFTF